MDQNKKEKGYTWRVSCTWFDFFLHFNAISVCYAFVGFGLIWWKILDNIPWRWALFIVVDSDFIVFNNCNCVQIHLLCRSKASFGRFLCFLFSFIFLSFFYLFFFLQFVAVVVVVVIVCRFFILLLFLL